MDEDVSPDDGHGDYSGPLDSLTYNQLPHQSGVSSANFEYFKNSLIGWVLCTEATHDQRIHFDCEAILSQLHDQWLILVNFR